MGKETYKKIKDAGSTAAAATSMAGLAYTATEGAKALGVELPSLPGTSTNPEVERRLEVLESKNQVLESEIKELKAANKQSSGQEQTTESQSLPTKKETKE